jgi:hypothetical protein
MFKCVGCAQHNKTRWARPDSNVMPWATGNNVQVRGLCTTQQDTMGPARHQCHAMGHRQPCSSAWAVHNTTRHDGPGPTAMSCHGPQTTTFKCVGCAQQNQTRWARHDNTDAHLVARVDALEPLEGKSKTVPLIQGTRRRLVQVHHSVGKTVDVDNFAVS